MENQIDYDDLSLEAKDVEAVYTAVDPPELQDSIFRAVRKIMEDV